MGTSQFNPANAGRADFTNLFEELAKARGGCADLDARLDTYEQAISQINTDIDINIAPDISTLKASLRRLIDTGAKNMTVYETAGGIRYCDIPVDLEAGRYHIYFGELNSDDTDGTKCLIEGYLFSEGHDVIIRPTTTPVLINRGEGANVEVVVNSKTDWIRVWAGEDKDASLEDDVSFADAMVCLQSDYELSPKFVEFVPTLAELYQDVLSIEQEIRNARGGKSSLDGRFNATDDAIAAEATARQTEDDVLTAALAGEIDTGAKNRLTISSGSSTPPTRWINIPVSVGSGNFRVSFGTLSSDDTDSDKCQACFLDASNTQVSNWLTFTRGTDVSAAAALTGAATTFRLYPSDSYAHSEGDTVTFTNGMVCAESEWAISQKYVPYCPTMPELYQMILALQSGGASLQSASPNLMNALNEAE